MALPSIGFVAPIVRAAIVSLKADLPGQIVLFNAEAANTVDLTAPATASYHFGATDTHSAFTFPQVEVAAVQGQTGQFAVGRVEVDHDVAVNVICWLEGLTGEVAPVYEQLLGMARVVIEVLSRPDAFGPEVELSNETGIFWRVSEAIPLDGDDPNREILKWRVPVFLQFRVETVERFV